MIRWVAVAPVRELGGQCSSSSGVPETNLPRPDIEPGAGQGRGTHHAGRPGRRDRRRARPASTPAGGTSASPRSSMSRTAVKSGWSPARTARTGSGPRARPSPRRGGGCSTRPRRSRCAGSASAGEGVGGASGVPGASLAKKGRARYCLALMEACSFPWGGQGSRGPARRPQPIRDGPHPTGPRPQSRGGSLHSALVEGEPGQGLGGRKDHSHLRILHRAAASSHCFSFKISPWPHFLSSAGRVKTLAFL